MVDYLFQHLNDWTTPYENTSFHESLKDVCFRALELGEKLTYQGARYEFDWASSEESLVVRPEVWQVTGPTGMHLAYKNLILKGFVRKYQIEDDVVG